MLSKIAGLMPLVFAAALWGFLIVLVLYINAAIHRDGNPFQIVASRIVLAVTSGR